MSDPRIEAVVDALRSTPTQSYADGYRAGRDAAVAEVDKFMIQEEVTAGDVQRNKPFIAVARAIRALPVPEVEPAEAKVERVAAALDSLMYVDDEGDRIIAEDITPHDLARAALAALRQP